MHKRHLALSGLTLALLLAGCATPVSTTIQPTQANIAKYSTLSALDVVTALEKNVNDAKASGMNFTAPHYYREAAQVLSDCQSGLNSKPKDQLAQMAAKGDAILEKGRNVMSIVQYRFAQELELKSKIDALDTAKLLPKDYEKTMGEFSGLIEKVERERPENIDKSKEALLKSLEALEIKSIQEGALHASEVINNENKAKLADKQVPETYGLALKAFNDAKTQIAAAPHDAALVKRLGAEALFAARHAQQVNERVALLQTQFKTASGSSPSFGASTGGMGGGGISMQSGGGSSNAAMDKTTVEKIVLQEEDRLLSISTALGHKDLRDLTIDKQVAELKRVAGEKAGAPAIAANNSKLEADLQAAQAATKQAMAQLAEKDQQLSTQAVQLADKDAQIAALNSKVTQLETAAASKPVAAVKSKAKKKK
ncbi:MAG: hypothetical protein PHI29_05555 [Gallionella sp.]|nr:hypothetical protein [Gallionella sp.]